MALDPLYTYKDYKKYLNDQIDRNSQIRGYKSLLADAAGCQRSFMSQVLNSHVHLTPDHALGLAQFWKMNQPATEFFLELVHLGRAATPTLREHLADRLRQLADHQRDEALRIEKPALREMEHASVYYSSWHWSALHMLVEIKGYQNDRALAERLHLPADVVRQALSALQGMGLVKKEKTGWVSTRTSLHVPADSIFSWMHHDSWRKKANEHMRVPQTNSVHFTGIYLLSRADRERIEDMLLGTVEKVNDIVGPSKEEDAVCLCVDWFGV